METLTNIYNYITEHFTMLLLALTTAISAASAIAALTPTPKDDGVVKLIASVIDRIALNIGHAKEK